MQTNFEIPSTHLNAKIQCFIMFTKAVSEIQ